VTPLTLNPDSHGVSALRPTPPRAQTLNLAHAPAETPAQAAGGRSALTQLCASRPTQVPGTARRAPRARSAAPCPPATQLPGAFRAPPSKHALGRQAMLTQLIANLQLLQNRGESTTAGTEDQSAASLGGGGEGCTLRTALGWQPVGRWAKGRGAGW
jgi:hypothetical protein